MEVPEKILKIKGKNLNVTLDVLSKKKIVKNEMREKTQ